MQLEKQNRGGKVPGESRALRGGSDGQSGGKKARQQGEERGARTVALQPDVPLNPIPSIISSVNLEQVACSSSLSSLM